MKEMDSSPIKVGKREKTWRKIGEEGTQNQRDTRGVGSYSRDKKPLTGWSPVHVFHVALKKKTRNGAAILVNNEFQQDPSPERQELGG